MTRQRLITILLVIAGFALLVWLLPPSISSRKIEQMARYRLHRLARAVNLHVLDHDQQWPVIVNPTPQTPWQPGRPGSAAEVLRPYLSGDSQLRPQRIGDKKLEGQRDDETYEAYIQRLRDRELTVCPITGFPYWWENPAQRGTPDEVVSGAARLDPLPGNEEAREGVPYFTTQLTSEGTAPYSDLGGDPVLYACFGIPVQRLVTPEEVTDMREQLRQIERQNEGLPRDEQTHDLAFLRQQVMAYETALHEHGGAFPVGALEAVVTTDPYP